MMPPPKKGRGGLIAIISIVVLVVIIGGIVAAVALGGKKGGTNTGNNVTPTPTATPTPSVPTGFTKFTGTAFSVVYPSDWMKEADSQGGGGEDFTGTTGQTFQISIDANGATADQIPLLLTTFCGILGNDKATPTPVTIGGQQWEQIDCGNTPTLHAVSDAIYYKNALYQITYGSITDTYDTDKTQYFSVMESSFTFLT
jgi:hypothetical protein